MKWFIRVRQSVIDDNYAQSLFLISFFSSSYCFVLQLNILYFICSIGMIHMVETHNMKLGGVGVVKLVSF